MRVILILSLVAAGLITCQFAQADPPAHKKAMAVHAPKPQIPLVAIREGMRGHGYFQFHIRADGTVSSVSVLKSTGHQILDDATVAALLKWRFVPGPREVGIPFDYDL